MPTRTMKVGFAFILIVEDFSKWFPFFAETTAAYEFISKLPSVAMTYSTQAMIKKLHSICTTVETVSNNEVITSLKRALNDLGKCPNK